MATREEAKAALSMAKAIQQDVILHPTMTEQDIERIVNSCGYVCDFRDEISGRGDGKSKRYVFARTRGKGYVKHSLGRIENVQAMDQDDLVKLINAKFVK